MTSRLDRQDHLDKLRTRRPPVPDTEVHEVLTALDASGLVAEVEPLVAQSTGRNRTLTVRALLLGMCLAAARNAGTVIFASVTNLLYFALTDETRERLKIPYYPDHAQGFEAAYGVVRRLFHRIEEAVDPSPLPKNHRLDRELVARLLGEADPDELASRRSLMLRVANRILSMSLLDAHPLLEGRWNGSAVLDATVIGTYAKGLSSDSPVTASDPDAGWYVRTTKHKDPLLTDTPAQERIKKRLYGYDACLVVARDPDHDGTPLPDGSANPDVVPSLVVAFSLDKPSHRPAEVALEALQHVDPRYPRGYLAGDRLYPDQKPDKFQLPIRAMGYQPVYDYAKDQLGVQAQFAGAELIEGNWYCPSMPQPLKDATKDLVAKKIDKQTWINRIRQRTTYLFLPKQRADAEGHRRMMCPAEANRTQCSLKPYTLGRGIHLPLIDPAPSPVGPPTACTQHTITIPPEAGAQLWQPLQYGTEEWQRVYFRLRNAIEGMNGFGKDPLYERLESGGTRRIRGIAAQAILLAFQLAHANKRKLATWAGSITLHGSHPHRRPTRRRKTKPLGTWTPEGYLTETTA
ncbi:hypothetical protein JJV70_06770 [Streptomyces sp. JJ66]|uniref:hypothetical protein n=1 Tax=Streptomyces sp. JJ66 TaxID=2803843 RepID=UPI001C58C86E|nr:hypothetical protein [Streptomyces sp. JJ66]MBW1601815.1 hypothetical protein [Streptomyces sp. JJ66]